LDGGRIVEEGTHADLIASGGRYWELLRRQQMEEELEEAVPPTASPSRSPV
jgi:ATP-binding cassette subfamily B protein